MSVAFEYAPARFPVVPVVPAGPRPVRSCSPAAAPTRGTAEVHPLFAPPAQRSVRLTRRGVVVLAVLVGVLAAALFVLARLSAPATPAVPAGVGDVLSGPVTVRPGDTLWSIAERVAPNRDPRAEVAELRRINGLSGQSGVQLVPGQVLRTR